MDRYGISTDVFESYVADFHGTTVILFEELAPDQETNKPVCIDCHGVHDMKSVDDPESTVIKENLLGTCQKCHPDATTNFPDSWLSHYRPSPEHSPVVYYVNLFYQILIPGVIGSMALFVVFDGSKRLRERERQRKREQEQDQSRSNKMSEGQTYQRFTVSDRTEHWVQVTSFTTLAITGLIQKYAAASLSEGLISSSRRDRERAGDPPVCGDHPDGRDGLPYRRTGLPAVRHSGPSINRADPARR